MEVSCEQDFILTQHPLSLGGLWPLPPTCEPDGEKGRRVQAVAARAIEELRERRAKWECGSLVDDKGKEVKVEMPEQELKKEVGKKRRRGMSEQEFEDLWQGALGEIMSRDEVISDSAGILLESLEPAPSKPSRQRRSPVSRSPAPSNEVFASRWRDIDSSLQA